MYISDYLKFKESHAVIKLQMVSIKSREKLHL